MAHGNGLLTRYAYDPVSFRLRRLRTEGYSASAETLTPQSGTVRQDTAYAYDLAGNITATRERAPQSGVAGSDDGLDRLFAYDALYRLLSATGRENQPTAATPWQDATRADGVASTTAYAQRYTYDLLGNILSMAHTAAPSRPSFTRAFAYAPPVLVGPGGRTEQPNYLLDVQVGGTLVADYAYDANGNVLRETQSRYLSWDAADQLRQFATWTGPGSPPTLLAYYVYDASGARTKKLTQTSATTWQVTVYVDGVFEHRYEVSNSTQTGEQTTLFVLDGQSRLYQRRAGDALGDLRPARLYTLEDHLGSASATVDTRGNVMSREEYYPFGETSFGSHEKQRYRFCGKERDAESGLYYYGMRYYAPWTCRFVSTDPLAAKYSYYTPYQYAGNKPIIAVDIDGLEADKDTAQQAKPKSAKPASHSPTSTSKAPKTNQVAPAKPKSKASASNDNWYMADRKANGLSGTNVASEPNTPELLEPALNTLAPPKGKYTGMANATSLVLLRNDASGGFWDDLAIPFLYGAAYLADRYHAKDEPVVVPYVVTAPEQPKERRIALSVTEQLAIFAEQVKADPYTSGWANVSDNKEQIRSKIIMLGLDPNTTFHMNLSTPKGRLDDPTNLKANAGGVTVMEFQTVMTLFRSRTTFYRKSGSVYKKTEPLSK